MATNYNDQRKNKKLKSFFEEEEADEQ